jgi:hypothetical protein
MDDHKDILSRIGLFLVDEVCSYVPPPIDLGSPFLGPRFG